MPIIKTQPEWIKHLDPKELEIAKTQLILGTNTYHRRKYRGLSQSELAKNAGVTQSIISELENGDYNPSIDVLGRISKALNIKLEILTKEGFNWRFFEALAYFLSKIKDIDLLKAMKLTYFSDLESNDILGYKILGLNYIRRYAGPFNKDIYIMDEFFDKKGRSNNFEKKEYLKNFVALSKNDLNFLGKIIKQYGNMTPSEIKEASYKTKPMEGIKIGDQKMMGKKVF